jgi:hypothetical protein
MESANYLLNRHRLLSLRKQATYTVRNAIQRISTEIENFAFFANMRTLNLPLKDLKFPLKNSLSQG